VVEESHLTCDRPRADHADALPAAFRDGDSRERQEAFPPYATLSRQDPTGPDIDRRAEPLDVSELGGRASGEAGEAPERLYPAFHLPSCCEHWPSSSVVVANGHEPREPSLGGVCERLPARQSGANTRLGD
jgi:hypothetical protein